jgi:hypothetical protein
MSEGLDGNGGKIMTDKSADRHGYVFFYLYTCARRLSGVDFWCYIYLVDR